MGAKRHTKFPFGKHRGMPIEQCPTAYLKWVSENLIDTDMHEFAVVAREVLEGRADDKKCHDIEEAADEFLRSHGIDPRNL